MQNSGTGPPCHSCNRALRREDPSENSAKLYAKSFDVCPSNCWHIHIFKLFLRLSHILSFPSTPICLNWIGLSSSSRLAVFPVRCFEGVLNICASEGSGGISDGYRTDGEVECKARWEVMDWNVRGEWWYNLLSNLASNLIRCTRFTSVDLRPDLLVYCFFFRYRSERLWWETVLQTM